MDHKSRKLPAVVTFVEGQPQRCLWCGRDLPRSRSDRRFDNDNCRMAFNRWRLRLFDLTRRIMADIKEISEYAPFVEYCDPRQQINGISTHLERYRTVTEKRVIKALEGFENGQR